MTRVILRRIHVLVFILLSSIVFAQPGGGPPDDEEPSDIPVDGGISILIASGVALGARTIIRKKKV